MVDFIRHTVETAPEAAKADLEGSVKAYGMVPGLLATMAEAPNLLKAYRAVHELFTGTSLNDAEKTVVWMAINVEHQCHYCVPAHTALALRMRVEEATIQALRDGKPLADPKLEALRVFTLKMVRQRGRVSDAEVEEFLAAGFTRQQVLEVVLGVAHKVMSNYVNAFAQTPVDAPFEKFAWDPKVTEPA